MESNDTEVLRTPSTWEVIKGIRIMDPDGWRSSLRFPGEVLPAQSFDVPVSEHEFDLRMSVSTIMAHRPLS